MTDCRGPTTPCWLTGLQQGRVCVPVKLKCPRDEPRVVYLPQKGFATIPAPRPLAAPAAGRAARPAATGRGTRGVKRRLPSMLGLWGSGERT